MADQINYEDLTVEQLEEKLLDISRHRDVLRDEALKINAVRDRKVALWRAQQKVASMSATERAALRQVINGTASGH